jgi:hypothetical protein
MNPILQQADVKGTLGKIGIDTIGGGPDRLEGMVKAEIRLWTDVARERNIRIDP